jgi:hypothetical protein
MAWHDAWFVKDAAASRESQRPVFSEAERRRAGRIQLVHRARPTIVVAEEVGDESEAAFDHAFQTSLRAAARKTAPCASATTTIAS